LIYYDIDLFLILPQRKYFRSGSSENHYFSVK